MLSAEAEAAKTKKKTLASSDVVVIRESKKESGTRKKIDNVLNQIKEMNINKPETIERMSTRTIPIYQDRDMDRSRKQNVAYRSIRSLLDTSNDLCEESKIRDFVTLLILHRTVARILQGEDGEILFLNRSIERRLTDALVRNGLLSSTINKLAFYESFVEQCQEHEDALCAALLDRDVEEVRERLAKWTTYFLKTPARRFPLKGSSEANAIDDALTKSKRQRMGSRFADPAERWTFYVSAKEDAEVSYRTIDASVRSEDVDREASLKFTLPSIVDSDGDVPRWKLMYAQSKHRLPSKTSKDRIYDRYEHSKRNQRRWKI